MGNAAAFIVLILGILLAYKLSSGKSEKRKYIVWGTAIIFVIAPLVSWLTSITYATIEGSGWAGIALIAIMFPILFILGLVILLIGIFRKQK